MAVKCVLVFTSLVVAAHSSIVPLERETGSTSFEYSVAEPSTGDFKHQVETRAANTVRGQYSLLQPDGLKRIVDYFADEDGFHAIVRYEPIAVSAPVIPIQFNPEPALPAPILNEPEPVYAEPEIRTPVVPESASALVRNPIIVAEELPYTETVEAPERAFVPSSYPAPASIVVEDRAPLNVERSSLPAPGPEAVFFPGRALLRPSYYRNIRSSNPTAK